MSFSFLFFCVCVQLLELRSDCLFCCYWWNCWQRLFKLYFHNASTCVFLYYIYRWELNKARLNNKRWNGINENLYHLQKKIIIHWIKVLRFSSHVSMSVLLNLLHRFTVLSVNPSQWLEAGRCFHRVLQFPSPIKLTATK